MISIEISSISFNIIAKLLRIYSAHEFSDWKVLFELANTLCILFFSFVNVDMHICTAHKFLIEKCFCQARNYTAHTFHEVLHFPIIISYMRSGCWPRTTFKIISIEIPICFNIIATITCRHFVQRVAQCAILCEIHGSRSLLDHSSINCWREETSQCYTTVLRNE